MGYEGPLERNILQAPTEWSRIVSIKSCPACHTDVPSGAYRCKNCFHDFDEKVVKGASPFMVLLKLAAAMAVVASIVFWQTSGRPSEVRVNVDAASQTVTGTQMSANGLSTQSMRFNEINQIEHRVLDGNYTVVVKSHDGRELAFPETSYSQEAMAEEVANAINGQGYNVMVISTGAEQVEILNQ